MNRVYHFFLGIILLLVGIDLLAAGVTSKKIEFRPFTTVKSGPITLFDLVADSQNININALKKIKIAETPEYGTEIKLSNTAVSQALVHSKNTDVIGAVLNIPKELVIQRRGWVSSLEKAKSEIPRMLTSLCFSECDIKIDEIQLPEKKSTYTDDFYFEVETIKNLPKGIFVLATKIYQNDLLVEKGWITGKFRVFKSLPIAKRLLLQGMRVDESDFEIKNWDVTLLSDTAPDLSLLINSKLARAVNVNQPILNGTLLREKDVVYGQPITVIVKTETWNVSLEAIARDGGSVGDRIRVMNPQTKKILSGVLVAKGIVEIK